MPLIFSEVIGRGTLFRAKKARGKEMAVGTCSLFALDPEKVVVIGTLPYED